MSSEYRLWPNQNSELRIDGAKAQLCGDWGSYGNYVLATMTKDNTVEVLFLSSSNEESKVIGRGTLAAGRATNPNSPQFVGVIPHAVEGSLRVAAWVHHKQNEEVFLACSVRHADDSPSKATPQVLPLVAVSGYALQQLRKQATVLAALRAWQASDMGKNCKERAVANDGGRFEPLSSAELDELIEEINLSWSKTGRAYSG